LRPQLCPRAIAGSSQEVILLHESAAALPFAAKIACG
jgi:hypothetical protein